MDGKQIKVKLVEQGFTVGGVLEGLEKQGITMSRNTWFKKLRGETEFTRVEIMALSKVLKLNKKDVFDIFFKD